MWEDKKKPYKMFVTLYSVTETAWRSNKAKAAERLRLLVKGSVEKVLENQFEIFKMPDQHLQT